MGGADSAQHHLSSVRTGEKDVQIEEPGHDYSLQFLLNHPNNSTINTFSRQSVIHPFPSFRKPKKNTHISTYSKS